MKIDDIFDNKSDVIYEEYDAKIQNGKIIKGHRWKRVEPETPRIDEYDFFIDEQTELGSND